MKIAATGITGLVGSRVKELLGNKYEFQSIGLSGGLDITDKDSVDDKVSSIDAKIVINFAAKADVDGSESEKALGKESEAWKINVKGAENLAQACHSYSKKFIHISTDFVFDGNKDFYTEQDIPTSASGWYGQTKLEGEKAVKESGANYVIARIAYPYRSDFHKKDFVRAMMGRLKEGLPIKGVVDHEMTPTFVDDIAFGIDSLIENDAEGIYHIVGNDYITPHDAAMAICEIFDLDSSLISETNRDEYFAGKAKRPFRLRLKNDKIQRLGVKMKTFHEGLIALKEQGLK